MRQPSVHDRFARPIVGRSIYMASRNGMIDRLVAAEHRQREGEERNVENAGFSLRARFPTAARAAATTCYLAVPCAKLDQGSPSPRRLILAAGEYLKAAGRGIVFRVSETVGVLRTSPRIDSRLNYLPVAIVSSRVLRDRGPCRYPRTVSSSSMTRYLRTDPYLCKLSCVRFVFSFLPP